MKEEEAKELFEGISPRLELDNEYNVKSEDFFCGLLITLDLSIEADTPLPPLHFFPLPESDLVNVKCYFCQKERTFHIGYYINSTWSPASFKNDERGVMICSPYCPTLLPSEQRRLFAYDNVRYKSPYTENDTYTGIYNFREPPLHEVDFRKDRSVWNRCYFCKKEETFTFEEVFYLPWNNLNFPTEETVRVCSQNCIPPEIV